MEDILMESESDVKEINFGNVPIDVTVQKYAGVVNKSNNNLSYRVSSIYIQDTIDRVFKVYISSSPVKPGEYAKVKVIFKPNVVGQSFSEYYVIEDTDNNLCRLNVTGKCFGPLVHLDKKTIVFEVCRNFSETRDEVIHLVNKSAVDTTFQWYMPSYGQGHFQITGICGLIRAHETITTTVLFTESALGIYTAELVCLILNQEPLYLNVYARVFLQGSPLYNFSDHTFEKYWKKKSPATHLMENSLNRLMYKPSASVFERYLDFSTGSVCDALKNISQTICVTNHEQEEGSIQWMPDPDNVFIIDPIMCKIPPNESKLFTVRFRPKIENEVYGYLMCGDYQSIYKDNVLEETKIRHTWFRIPCTGNTWPNCVEWSTEWNCPVEVVMPPTVPTRTTFTNFMLSNKFEIPMHFKFEAPYATNYVVMPICGIVQGRGWQIISVALEPKCFGDYCETWDIVINKVQTVSIVPEPGQNLVDHFLSNHNCLRVLNFASWLGADKSGTIVIRPKEIVNYRWWFFPRTSDKEGKVYETVVTCSCVCLIKGRPVGEPTEVHIHLSGFSELPNLRMLPNSRNLHDIPVGESLTCSITLYNNGSCYYTSKLYYIMDGMGDDFSGDIVDIDSTVNSLKPSSYCEVKITITPYSAGPRQITIKYTVLYRTEFEEVKEIQPITMTICNLWYDGIYPTLKVLRTISIKCPIIMSNYCVWKNCNVDELNKAFVDCRPNQPLDVNLYAPDLCIRSSDVEIMFVLGCLYELPVPWDIRREKICDCEMVEVQVGISMFEMRHNCVHRQLVELYPSSGIVSVENPNHLYFNFKYDEKQSNVLCYVITMPNDRSLNLYININASINNYGFLVALRRPVYQEEYLAVLDCGRVPINNLDPVIRIVWLYNPTDMVATWSLLRENGKGDHANRNRQSVIRCLLYFAEVPAFSRLAIPIAFLPSEMIEYQKKFVGTFGYETVKILVKGQGGLPNSIESRPDLPNYVERVAREAFRTDVVYLSKEHLKIPPMLTHTLSREIISINNDTDHVLRFIWLPHRVCNLMNIIMTPCWGMLQPKSTEWITMTIYSGREPATFTAIVACEILDLTNREKYYRNEYIRRNKNKKCLEEFIITEEGTFHPEINDSPPYVEEMEKPQPSYLALTVSVCTKGQRDGYRRMTLRELWEQVPPYELPGEKEKRSVYTTGNYMRLKYVAALIDRILWDALHSKMFKNQLQHYSNEAVPTFAMLSKKLKEGKQPRLSKRVTSGICDAIVNKAVSRVYDLNPRQYEELLMESE